MPMTDLIVFLMNWGWYEMVLYREGWLKHLIHQVQLQLSQRPQTDANFKKKNVLLKIRIKENIIKYAIICENHQRYKTF